MKRLTRVILPVAAMVMSVAAARAEDLNVAIVGPITGQYAAFGEQMRRGAEMAVADINAKGGVLGRKLKLAVGDDACDPKQAVNVANHMANNGVRFVDGHYLLGLVDPGVVGLCRERHAADLAGLDQSEAYRRRGGEGLEQRLPRLRPRRRAGPWSPGATSPSITRARRSRSSTTRSPYGKGLADETKKAMNAAGASGGDVRGDQRRRQGFLGARQQDEAGRNRRADLSRRLPHRGGPAGAPGARAGFERAG